MVDCCVLSGAATKSRFRGVDMLLVKYLVFCTICCVSVVSRVGGVRYRLGRSKVFNKHNVKVLVGVFDLRCVFRLCGGPLIYVILVMISIVILVLSHGCVGSF